MDYRVSDLHADPAGYEAYCSEKLIRLEGCFLCYEPSLDAPEPAVAPFREKGFITFGSFNNLSKINDKVVELWAGILRQLPGARFVIKNPGLTDAAVREDYLSRFAQHGVDDDRLVLKGLSATTREHLGEYRHIDIGLDTFPYNGTTTTCEAMWMGVPVLTLTGGVHASRVGSSLLSAAGMEQWIAGSPDDYVGLAVKYAGDEDFLERQRDSLRDRMANSALCDGARFAAAMEDVYRSAWQAWSANNP
jgi:predicted O-linked N-acetylglucosamine transferase (SPINDLY family)